MPKTSSKTDLPHPTSCFLGSDPHHRQRPLAAAIGVALALISVEAHAQAPVGQLSPTGYLGAINTPRADVISEGHGVLSVTNSNPERARRQLDGSFGSINVGVGLLPGLEVAGRLAYEGRLGCSIFADPKCFRQRDLSVSAKYQLPWRLPLNTRVAVGATDFGGAATNYRHHYGVATSTLGPLDLSLGVISPEGSRGAASYLDGAFGSAAYRVNEQFTALIENDSTQWRAGVQVRQPLGRDVALQLAASRKFGGESSGQQPWQVSVALQLALGGTPLAAAELAQSVRPLLAALPATAQPMTAAELATALHTAGFVSVQVRHWPARDGQAALWQVRAEPRRWRQNQAQAVGAALAPWLRAQGASGTDAMLLTLTYQQQPVLHAHTRADCLRTWLQGEGDACAAPGGNAGDAALTQSNEPAWPAPALARLQTPPADEAQAGTEGTWLPQIELGLDLRSRVGTEFGLADASVAADIGAEVSLASILPGLFWQGNLVVPVAHSRRFDDDQIFGNDRHDRVKLDQALLSYWTPLPYGAAVQANVGYLDSRYAGGQVDARWLSPSGRWRASALAGAYRRSGLAHTPVLGALRYGVLPGRWQLQATAGQFLGGDRGVELSSIHQWGDTQMKLVYSRSQFDGGPAVAPQRQLLGFVASFPLGPREAQALGPLWVRGADRWGWGLKTKVGEKDNILTSGYAEIPAPRHGLDSDASDFDRNGRDDRAARIGRVREALVEALQARP